MDSKVCFWVRLHRTVQGPIFRLFTVCSVLFKATFSDCHGKVGLWVTVYIGKLKPIWCMLMDFLSRLSLLVESRCRIGEARRSCSIVSFTTQPKANTATTTQRYKRLNKLFEFFFHCLLWWECLISSIEIELLLKLKDLRINNWTPNYPTSTARTIITLIDLPSFCDMQIILVCMKNLIIDIRATASRGF